MTSNKCHRCGLVNFAGTPECRRCKEPIAWGADGVAAQPAFSSPPPVSTGGGESHQQQPFNPTPSQAIYAATASGYDSPNVNGRKLRSGMAVTSLVLGILGMFSAGIFLVGAVTGLVLGIRAVFKAKREPYSYGGKGLAIGGIVTNSLGLVSIVPFAIIAAIAIPNLLASRIAANEAGAIGQLRTLAGAQATYQSTGGGGRTFGSMEDLTAAALIPQGSQTKNGYQFKIRLLDRNREATSSRTGGDAVHFEVLATPASYGSSGRRSFYVSEDYVIRCADRRGREAILTDPSLDDFFEQQDSGYEQRRPRRY